MDPREIYKSASAVSEPVATAAADEFDFVLSDETPDRLGDVIMAAGWKLANFKRNPIALFGHSSRDIIGTWKNVKVESARLVGTLKLAAAGTSEIVDTVRSLLTQKILKAVSVGFQPIKHEPIDEKDPWGAWRFLASELLEVSVVAVPANPNAVALKDLPLSVQRIFAAESGMQAKRRDGFPAGSGDRTQTPRAKTMTLAERIAAAQAEQLRIRNALVPIAKKIENEEELTDDETETMTALEAELATVEKNLTTLRSAERALGRAAAAAADPLQTPGRAPPPGAPASPAIIARMRGGSTAEQPFDLLVKLAVCHLLSHGARVPIEQIKMQRYRDRDDLDAVIKAATTTNPALTSVAGWAAELVSDAMLDMMTSLVPVSVYAALAARGLRFSFGRNGIIKLPRRNKIRKAPGDLRGAWVGEGAPIPVRRGSIGMSTFTPKKVGVISTYSREMMMYSTPAIEAIIRDGMREDTADTLDDTLLSNLIGTAARPAGLLYGVAAIPGSAAGGWEATQADIGAALAPFVAANAVSGLVWLVNPANTMKLSLMTTPLGIAPTAATEIKAGLLGGLPFIASTNVDVQDLALVRYVDFASATGDDPQFEVSDSAVVHESDGDYPADDTAPGVLPIGTPGAPATIAAPVRSLWQTASFGIRMLMDVDYAMRRPGMVSLVTPIDWTVPVTP